jgi:hypothetical protein
MTPSLAAPAANALNPRINSAPSAMSRPSFNCHGSGLAAGSGNAAVLVISKRRTCASWASAQPKPIIPPQSCTASVTGPSMPRVSNSVFRSSTRDCSV